MVDTSGHRMPPDDEVPDRFYELCDGWAERLRDEKLPFTRLALICKEICNTVGRKAATARYGTIDLAEMQPSPPATLDPAALDTFAPELPPMVVARRLLAHLLDGRKTHSQRKIVAKSYYNVWCQNLLDGAPLYTMWGGHDLADPDDNSVALYGMLHSRFLTPLQTVPGLAGMVADRNLALFLSPAAGYTRWFNTASENLLAIARHVGPPGLYGHERLERLWHVALTNLESPYHGAREYMLALLKLLVRDETFAQRTVRPEWARWSWLDRNKFHLLALLLDRYRWEKLRDALPLSEQQLADGLRLSLRYKHLYAGGQTLVRLLYTNQHMADTVYGLVASVILSEPAAIVQTMVKYWFSFFTPKSYRTVYERLALDAILTSFAQRPGPTDGDTLPPYLSSNRYEKLFLLVYLFRQQVQSSGVLQPLLVQLCALAETLQPLAPATLDLLICSLGHYLVACGATGRIDTLQHMVALTRHVQCAMEAPGQMATCRTCVTVCQRLLTHIATTQQEQHRSFPLDAQAHLAKFMSYDMYDRYLLPAGSTPLDYQPTVTALRLFAAFVEQCFEFPATSPYVLQIRADGAVRWIGPLLPATLPLPELGASFRSMVYGLQHLLRSDFDDIRAITLTMLYNRAGAFCYDPRLQSQLATVHSGAAATPDAPDHVRTTVRLLLNVTLARLAAAMDDHERDFYASVLAAEEDNPSGQLHRLIERCTEVCFGFAGPAGGSSVLGGDDLLDAHCCLDTVCAFMLRSLSPTTPPADQCIVQTNFRQLDRCLERLLNQSDVWRRTRTVADDAEEAGSSDCLQVSLAKRKIQVALWKTLRALAIFFEQHAIRIMDRQVRSAGEQLDVFRQELASLVAIMVSCCHRGAIEATGLSLSRVVRHAVQLKEQDPTLHRAVKQVYCRWRDYAPASPDDFRENRGLIWMRHCFLRHDTTDLREGSLLRDLLHHKLKLGECALYHERGGQRVTVEVLWLHQLNLIARETALNESILPHLDELLIVALSHIRVPRWCVRNAALQLYASCAQKLTGQGQQQCDPGADWPPAYTAFEEVACKATRTIRYMIRQLDGMLPAPTNGYRRSKRRTQPDHCPTIPFQLLVLQFLSKLEYRGYGQHHHPEPVAPSSTTPCPPHLEMVGKLRAILWQLLGHEHDLVRKLAARCFAQLHDYATELPALLEPLVHELFSTRGSVNFRHGLCRAVLACVQRYVTLCRHVQRDETDRASQRTATLQRVREMVSRHWHHETGAAPFRYRSELLGLLLYLGFARDSPVLEALVLNRTAPNAFGQAVLVMQLNQLYGGAACTVSPAGVVSIDPTLIDTGAPCAQSTALPYEINLEWDRELDALEAAEDD